MKTKSISTNWKRTMLATALTSLLIGGYSLYLPIASAMNEPANAGVEAMQFGPPSFARLVQQVKPAVVNIAVKGKAMRVDARGGSPFGSSQPPKNLPFNELFKHQNNTDLTSPSL